MLCSNLKRPFFFNKSLQDYCLKSTNESIKKMIEKCDEERKYKSIKFNLTTNDSCPEPNNNNNIIPFICFLSISSFLLYFYNRKANMFSYCKYIDESTK
jgi:hypothetical protein